jgi:hypothetical protein
MLLGLIAGFLVAGGYLFSFFGAGRVTGLNLYSVESREAHQKSATRIGKQMVQEGD